MLFQPQYRVVVYAPRREDLSESTPIVPIAGASHSLSFQVATYAGEPGFQPFLFWPSGASGKIDFLTRKGSTGHRVYKIMDTRVLPGGGNAQRFVTAYVGDAQGRNRLNGCRVVEWSRVRSTDPWALTWTGRISNVSLAGDNPRTALELTVDGEALELNRPVFEEAPHASATYARVANVLPNQFVGSFGGITGAQPIKGIVRAAFSVEGGDWDRYLVIDRSERSRRDLWMTKLLADLNAEPLTSVGHGYYMTHPTARVHVKRLDTGQAGWFRLRKIISPIANGLQDLQYVDSESVVLQGEGNAVERVQGTRAHYQVTQLGIQALRPTEAGYMPAPPAQTPVEFYVVPGGKRSATAPLYIDDVHPVQLLADMLDGKFCRLAANGSIQAHNTVAREPTSWAALLADQTFYSQRLIVEKAGRLRDALSEICLASGLAWWVNGAGQVVLIDVRPAKVPATLPPEITMGDMADGETPEWNPAGADQVTRLECAYYVDRLFTAAEVTASTDVYPEIPAGGILSSDVPFTPVDFGEEAKQGEKPLTVETRGYRVWSGRDLLDAASRADVVRRALDRLDDEIRGPYAYAPTFAKLHVRRTAATQDCQPGHARLISADMLPNQSSNERGGTRLMRCIERWERGGTITLQFLDLPDSYYDPPTLGALTGGTAEGLGYVELPVTLAGGHAVVADVALTDGGVAVRPAEGDPAWMRGHGTSTSGTLRVPHLQAGRRAWVRARTQGKPAKGDPLRLPSAWVFPAGAGFVDLAALPGFANISDPAITDATGAASVGFAPAAGTAGVRLHYGTGAAGTSPAVAAYVDAAAGAVSVVLPVTVARGQVLAVEYEAWSGWTGAAVSGTANPQRIRRTASRGATPDTSILAPTLAVDLASESDQSETHTIVAQTAPGASLPLLWRVHQIGQPAGQFTVEADGVLSTEVTLDRPAKRPAMWRVEVQDGDGRATSEPIVVGPGLPGIGSDGRTRLDVPYSGGGTRTPGDTDGDALAGRTADTDLQRGHVGGYYDRASGRVLQVRDSDTGQDVAGGVLADGARRARTGLDTDGRGTVGLVDTASLGGGRTVAQVREQAAAPTQNLMGAGSAEIGHTEAMRELVLADALLGPGALVSVSAEMKSAAAGDAYRLVAIIRDSGNNSLATHTGTVLTGTSPQRSVIEGVTLPAGAHRVEFYRGNVSAWAGSVTFDRVMVNRGPLALAYERPSVRLGRADEHAGILPLGDGELLSGVQAKAAHARLRVGPGGAQYEPVTFANFKTWDPDWSVQDGVNLSWQTHTVRFGGDDVVVGQGSFSGLPGNTTVWPWFDLGTQTAGWTVNKYEALGHNRVPLAGIITAADREGLTGGGTEGTTPGTSGSGSTAKA